MHVHILRLLLSLLVIILLIAGQSRAQEDFIHPELEWKTIETEHFLVHFHGGAERTAKTVAKIAEEIFEPVTSLYNHKPTQKVSFIIKDYDDISNGAAYFFDNKIELYAPSMDFELRGTHNWLRNVVTHEFTHIVQIQTTMKFGRQLPAFYLQWLGYESERRPDVLYGYPNIVVSYPLSGFVVPAWFAEGIAQYNRKELRYDFWDSHRDMILRSYALDGNMLTWEQMGVFGKTSLGNESSYNAGFAFISYLSQKYGEAKLAEISRNLSTFTEVTIDGAIKRAVGKSGSEVYDEWRDEIRKQYAERVAPIRAALRQGEPIIADSSEDVINPGERQKIETIFRPNGLPDFSGPHQDACCQFNAATGFANMYPVFSPDGNKIAYVSTKGADYFSLSSLYVYDLTTKKETLIQPGVRTSPCWTPDGKALLYGRITRSNPHWSLQFDIYSYNLEEKTETRVTTGHRAISPAVSPDGKMVAFVTDSDGTTNLAVAGLDGSGYRVITPFSEGEQVYDPKWSPAGDLIVFDYSIKDGRDIATIRPDGTGFRFIVQGDDDSRSGSFSPDGQKILFSSDRTGIFNLYYYTVATGSIDQVTNVLGGAFFSTVNGSGNIVYSAYTSGGYKLYSMEKPGLMAAGDHAYLPAAVEQGRTPATPQFDWVALRTYDDTKVPSYASRSYRNTGTSLTFVPFLRVDNYNTKSKGIEVLKPGVYLFSNDVLDKTGFFAGAAINSKLDRDLFLQFFYRGKIPLLYQLGLDPVASIELYNVTRTADKTYFELGLDTLGIDVSYSMLEFDFSLMQPVFSQFSTVEFRYIHSRYTSILGSFVLPAIQQLVAATSDLYLIGNDLSLTYRLDAIVPSRTSEINPVGRKVTFKADRELNKFNGDGQYEVTSSGLRPVYKTVNFTRLELNWKESIPFFFKNHTLSATLRGGTILGPPVDEFFDFYGGGLIGMKGYPFYALGGNELAVLGMAYRFPIFNNIDIRFLQFYFDKLYGSIYGDFGNAWTDGNPALKQFKTDAGAELRLESFSFYSFPTRIFFNASYGFNQFDKFIRSRNETVTYGKEWRFYFGILFGFDFD